MIPNPGTGEFILASIVFFAIGWGSGTTKGKHYEKLEKKFYLSSLYKFSIIPIFLSMMLIGQPFFDPLTSIKTAIESIFYVNAFFFVLMWLPNTIGQYLGYRHTGLEYGVEDGCCLRCGYSLAQTDSSKCPDCGFVMPSKESE